jgi:hypothetical protein
LKPPLTSCERAFSSVAFSKRATNCCFDHLPSPVASSVVRFAERTVPVPVARNFRSSGNRLSLTDGHVKGPVVHFDEDLVLNRSQLLARALAQFVRRAARCKLNSR